ncbi:hypothetical protein [Alkaliphilus sp. B6464]|uniref:hypothetical protein n=1 Tax=Alkaliphilus sp. B6464 TaxID=2731219 RepID=UPI001BAD5C52|nr:hypothetical protein [Alkaliphilus sp. B6464]QUH21875.1 hypothetical protein HYG84_18230 [Alkaliphilus sp. B6464]
MAINDVYTTHKCINCGSKIEEIPINDYWGYHVLSMFKCINEKCKMQINCSDIDINDYVETTYHRK